MDIERHLKLNKQLDATVYGVFLRAVYWMRTLSKLTDYLDFQAAYAGERALWEIDADLIEGTADPNFSLKLEAWDLGLKCKSASHGAPVGPIDQQRYQMLATQLGWVDKNGKLLYPETWMKTSVRAKLDTAIKRLNSSKLAEIDSNYPYRWSLLNWGTHGSGLALMYNMGKTTAQGQFVICLNNAAKLADEIADQAMKHYSLPYKRLY